MNATRVRAIVTTIFLWAYFMGAFVAGGFMLFLVAGLVRGRRGIGWALATYTRTFLFVVRLVIPRLRFVIPDRRELRQLRSTVVVCNHLSFLDPLLAAPILVLRIDGTDHVFAPGRLTFDVSSNRSIEVRKQALVSAEEAADCTTHELTLRARAMLEPAQARSQAR